MASVNLLNSDIFHLIERFNLSYQNKRPALTWKMRSIKKRQSIPLNTNALSLLLPSILPTQLSPSAPMHFLSTCILGFASDERVPAQVGSLRWRHSSRRRYSLFLQRTRFCLGRGLHVTIVSGQCPCSQAFLSTDYTSRCQLIQWSW